MSDTNIVVIKGRLTRPAELKYTQGQRPFVNFSLAVNDSIKNTNTGEWENRPSFFDVTVWGKYGESVAKYMTKGREVLVTGRLRQERWQGNDGKTQTRVCVISENMELLRESKGTKQAEELTPPQAGNTPPDAPSFDNLPPSDVNGYTDPQPIF